ncbi:autotransporter outer membrane beta-barrel domain-containing protein [Brucella abortus]|uniref:autotransporter outer membrane beta-barrel domain-containing protein n=1 Tax=Brucella abortus TaxID=235 RepID=UPI000B9D6F3C|nr:autotransporter outer membrane beta-barrel domain-containing protein [Brucella abortus]ASU72957.1 autotransporter outer membrane beta-barrel domain-containing protein [Brucella abortus]
MYVVGNSALVTIINNGTITGGAGGLNSAWPDNYGATGGMGEGGAAGSIRTGGSQGTSSQGGAGIIGANIAVINNGTITGGIGGTGGLNAGVQNDAVTFQSGINSLTLTTKSVINGVVSANGNDDTLTLQNTLSKIDGGQSDGANISATQYKGFEHLVVNGGRWTVSGSAIVSGETTLNGGALVVTGPAALGVQAITAQGGAIEASGDQVLDQSFVLKNNPYGASTSGLVVQGADNLVLSGVLSDVGRLTKNGSGTLTLSGANSYTGATTVSAGTLVVANDNTGGGTTTVDVGAGLQIGTGGVSGSLAGDIVNNGTLVVDRSNAFDLANVISGTGSLTKNGAGTLTLSGVNSYTGGTTVSAGTLAVRADNNLGDASGGLAINGGATLQLTDNLTTARGVTLGAGTATITIDGGKTAQFSNKLTGSGTLAVSGSGTLILSAANDYSGNTTIASGSTLQLGDGSTDGRLAGNVANAGTLTFHNKGGTTFAGEISGTGSLVQNGAGALTLSGDSQGFAGTTTVSSGSLLVSGKLGGTVTVNSGATLDGSGEIGGNTTVNGTLEGASGNGLTFKGDLKLGSGSIINASFDHPGGARIFDVTGDIALDGTVNVSSFGTGGPGLYHLFHYAGTSSGSGLTLGSLPGGVSVDKVYINQQVNDIYVVNTTGATLNYWNGTQSRPQGDGLLHGGNGTWTAATGNFNWTNSPSYDLNGAWDNGAFAVFGGGKGLVTVDTSAGAISASGMQFITTGYKLSGDKLTLVPTTSNPSAKPLIRVGSGSPGDSALIAIISTELTGTHGLEKADGGTLILTGANTYTGGTAISGGTLQLGDGATNGSVQGAISTGADAAHKGVLAIRAAAGTPATIGNTISGTGSVSVLGGTVTFSVANSYTGGTTLAGGTTIVTADANLGAVGTNVALNNGATLRFGANLDATHSFTHAFQLGTVASDVGTLDTDGHDVAMSGVISGAGGLMKSGTGTVTLSGVNTYTGGTTLTAGTLAAASDNNLGGASGGLTFNGGTLQVMGTSWTSTNRAVSLQAGGGTFDIEDAANNFAVTQGVAGAGGLTKSGSGTLTLSGANSYTGATTVSAGTLVVANDNTGGGTTTVDAGAVLQIGTGGTSGNLAGDIANNGALVVNRSDALNLANAISGAGSLMKSGAGTLTLSGANSYTGATTVSAGRVARGAAGGFSTASSRYDVDTDGTLDLGGFDTMLAALYNAGTINMNVGAAGSTLMVNGDYVGHDGTIVFNTVLGDDNSKTDKLMVGGDTAGNTNVQVVNRDGLGAQTVKGIEIITVGGQSNGVFSLVSDYRTKDGRKAVVGGAYAYTLHQGPARGANDGDWYLISQLEDIKPDNPATRRVSDTPDAPDTPAPRYSANVPVYEGYVQTMQALNKPSTLQERVGKRYMTGENGDGRTSGGMVDAHGIWARIQGAHDRLEPTTLTGMKQEINTFILQAGVDGQFYEDENGKLIAGITGQYGTARSNIVARDGDGRISTNAWSLGATATWIGNDGFYVDTQGQVTWFESDLNSDTADVGLASGRKATGYALSVETGKRIALNGNWVLTPQAQLIWSSINADDFEDVWQANISVARGNSFAARFGLAASYDSSWQGSDGRVVNTSVYGITNLYQEFLGGTRVNISGVDFSTDNDRTWAGIGAGGTYAWAGGKYLIFGQGTINTSLDHFADSYAIKGDVGFKVKW